MYEQHITLVRVWTRDRAKAKHSLPKQLYAFDQGPTGTAVCAGHRRTGGLQHNLRGTLELSTLQEAISEPLLNLLAQPRTELWSTC